ncbi:transcription factor bHLH18-like [Panicum virgatum]|uniref:transcription factor bHLH18-like n=1 Tax=Panicum virgatum TaxID=38727 RepID=UPI0019D64C90|nr:transcription factor bHLH18-like [Panicum virgatum]
MEDTSLFIKCATNALQHEQPAGLAAGDLLDFSEATFPSLQALREASHAAEMVQELITGVHAPNISWSSGGGGGAASWTFGATTFAHPGSNGLRGLPDLGHGAPPTRRAGVGSMSASYAQDHIIAERKRREKINQRFIELSTVIPGLKKMDKATILSDATRHVKELQEKLKDVEAGASSGRSIETRLVLVKRPCLYAEAAAADDDGSQRSASPGTPPAATKELPEIEVRFSEKNVMVRVHCEKSKGVAVKVLAEIEGLQLTVVHANVMLFSACTLIIAITAKAT